MSNNTEYEFRIVIAGPRDYSDYHNFKLETSSYFVEKGLAVDMVKGNVQIVSGGCSDKQNGVLTYTRKDRSEVFGVDGMAERYAEEYGIPVKIFKADWKKFGKSAGPIRNKGMADYGTHLMAWDNGSKGTANMINAAHGKLLTELIKIPKP